MLERSINSAQRPRGVVQILAEDAPRHPACFNTQVEWTEYLLTIHLSGDSITKRQDIGKHTTHRVTRTVLAIEPLIQCQDCQIGGQFQTRMVREGRCELVMRLLDRRGT
jgi:hypothetical protein